MNPEPENDRPVVLARSSGSHGETVLRRRGEVVELVVDGVFAMDTTQTGSEAALATLALDRFPADTAQRSLRVVVGGLGLGVTTGALLSDPRVGRVEVIELDAALTGWMRAGMVPSAAGVLDDPRVRVHLGDIAALLPAMPADCVDVVLLDVDNGPDFLVHTSNARLYTGGFLRTASRRLRSGGVLAIWSSDPSPTLHAAMTAACGSCDEILLPVRRDGREFDYAVYVSVVR